MVELILLALDGSLVHSDHCTVSVTTTNHNGVLYVRFQRYDIFTVYYYYDYIYMVFLLVLQMAETFLLFTYLAVIP